MDLLAVEVVSCEPVSDALRELTGQIPESSPFRDHSGQIDPVPQAFLFEIPVHSVWEFFNDRREFVWA
jgi:hypothetical protein